MFIRVLVILCSFLWPLNAKAQLPQQVSSSMPEQWQLTLDVIKSKAQTLMAQNNGLQEERRQLLGQLEKIQQSIAQQRDKNEQMEHFLKERHGRSDQQVRLEELTPLIKAKRQQVLTLNKQLEKLNREQSEVY